MCETRKKEEANLTFEKNDHAWWPATPMGGRPPTSCAGGGVATTEDLIVALWGGAPPLEPSGGGHGHLGISPRVVLATPGPATPKGARPPRAPPRVVAPPPFCVWLATHCGGRPPTCYIF
ncbi:hypothetical protein FH972_002909 [Carpinus fangiana]|uniref:Uncharacterized protein n=1 Tax=Carpinus fangiana TaxID=176857 RepID=A0A5N6QGB4_9ROSI|nr:hypothetical protein FH972_002909 [Carpinus fangiana]